LATDGTKPRPTSEVVGQVLRYMGWVKRNLCPKLMTVRGIIIRAEDDACLSLAVEMGPNVDVRYYEASFRLKETPSKNS
jgi:restriction system protein